MMKSFCRLTCSVLIALLLAQDASATQIFMPAGSTVWMKLEGNACPFDDGGDCIGANQPGVAPPNGIPLSAFAGPTGATATGYAEILPDQVRTFLAGRNGASLAASFVDTYTVGGDAIGPFSITVVLRATGTARSVQVLPTTHAISGAFVEVEIGTFSGVGDAGGGVALPEQFRVTPFGPTTRNNQAINSVQAASFSVAIDVSTSHTFQASVGDVFDLAYGVNTALSQGELDLLDTGRISFDLPSGVFLTSALAAVVPEPAASLLLGLGLCLAAARSRARR